MTTVGISKIKNSVTIDKVKMLLLILKFSKYIFNKDGVL